MNFSNTNNNNSYNFILNSSDPTFIKSKPTVCMLEGFNFGANIKDEPEKSKKVINKEKVFQIIYDNNKLEYVNINCLFDKEPWEFLPDIHKKIRVVFKDVFLDIIDTLLGGLYRCNFYIDNGVKYNLNRLISDLISSEYHKAQISPEFDVDGYYFYEEDELKMLLWQNGCPVIFTPIVEKDNVFSFNLYDKTGMVNFTIYTENNKVRNFIVKPIYGDEHQAYFLANQF